MSSVSSVSQGILKRLRTKMTTPSKKFSSFAPKMAQTSTNMVYYPLKELQYLSQDEYNHFDTHGFVKSSNILSPEQKRQVIQYTEEISQWEETPFKWMQYHEVDSTNGENTKRLCRVENYIDYHNGFSDICNGILKSAVSELFGEEATMYKEKINFKLPGGGAFEPHQDSPAYTSFPQIKYHITAMICIDNHTLKNGCLYFVHNQDFHKSFQVLPHTNNGSIPQDITSKYEWIPLTGNAGDVVFFHSFVPHKSYKNTSDTSRIAHFITYNKLSEGDKRIAYYELKREHFPPQIERIPGKDYSEGAKIFNLANPIGTKGN